MPLRAVVVCTLVLAAGMGACQYPRDPEGTLDRVRGGTLRVGVTEHEPWVRLEGDDPQGVEVRLIEDFARRHDADVEYTTGSEEELVDALREGALDVALGGFTKANRWKRDVAPTRPYATTKLVVGLPAGATFDGDPDVVFVERGSEAGGLVQRRLDSEVEGVDRLGAVRGRPAAVEEWLLDDLRLQRSETLKTDRHILFARLGENALLVALERYLEARRDDVDRLLAEEGRP